ncbi:histidine kinase [Nocardiopsis sp. ARC36]
MIRAVFARFTAPELRVSAGWRSVFGLLLAAFCVAATLSTPAAAPVRPPDALGLALLVVPSLAAGWTTAAPRAVLTLTSFAAVGFYALGYSGIFAPAPATTAVLGAASTGFGIQALAAGAAVCVGSFVAGLAHGLAPTTAAVGPGWVAGWTLAACAVGEVLRQRRLLREQERARAEDAARRGAERERLRIARELHDSLTHSISVINVQASVTAHLLDRDPGRVPAALDTIRAASADALRELRSTVEVLRRIDPDGAPGTEPAPGLSRLPLLATRSQAAGLEVEMADGLGRAPLAPEVDRAAYRVVQEALANAARHAPGSRVRVEVARDPHALRVTVTNGPAGSAPSSGTWAGLAVPAPGGGTGLVGMRERVEALGGELSAGPHRGGFCVHAVLPDPGHKETSA